MCGRFTLKNDLSAFELRFNFRGDDLDYRPRSCLSMASWYRCETSAWVSRCSGVHHVLMNESTALTSATESLSPNAGMAPGNLPFNTQSVS